MRDKIYPGKHNKRAKRSYGINKKLAEFKMLLKTFKAIQYVKKKKFNTAIYPFQLKLQTHTDCNGECIFCPHKDIRNMFPQEKMSLELYKKIILDFTSDRRAKDFSLELHNEPLMDDKLFERVSLFQKYNIHEIPCVISTNGRLLTKEMCDKLLTSGIDIIQISVNGLDKYDYEIISQRNNFEEFMDSLNYFLNLDLSKIGVLISFVSTAMFEKELKKAARKWRRLGLEVVVHHLSNRGGALKDYDKYAVKRKNFSLIRGMNTAIQNALLQCCPYPFYQLNILANGKAILCTHDWERKTIIGDLNKQSISEVWNSDEMNEIRHKIIAGKYDEIDACKECSVKKTYAQI